MARELWAFVVHLRLHYQVFILSGGYLLGGLLQPEIHLVPFSIQFVNVHVLLNGGVTAFNSYFDEDEGPIGGLENPPELARWTLMASVFLQLAGAAIGWLQGPWFVGLVLSTILLSVAYSAPPLRWKGHPWLSFVAVGIGTGTNTFLMGYIAAGPEPISATVLLAAMGVALLLLSLYPVSQLYQMQEDAARGDVTFATRYGVRGVQRLYRTVYPIGLLFAAAGVFSVRPVLAGALLLGGAAGGTWAHRVLNRLRGRPEEYRGVMRVKYGASLSFVSLAAVWLGWSFWAP